MTEKEFLLSYKNQLDSGKFLLLTILENTQARKIKLKGSASDPTVNLTVINDGTYYVGTIWVGSNYKEMEIIWDTGSAVSLKVYKINQWMWL